MSKPVIVPEHLLRDFTRSYVAQQEEAQQYDAWLAKKVEQARASAEAGKRGERDALIAAMALSLCMA